MNDKSLIPVPDGQGRRGAARRARMERRRAVAERSNKGQSAPIERLPEGAEAVPAIARAEPVPAAAPTFVLPARAQLQKRSSRFGQFIKMMFLIVVVLPTLLTILFYGFVASNQFATESAFAVRGSAGGGSAVDLSGLFSMGTGTADSETADSFILQQYIGSREMVEILIGEANFLEIYSRPSADPYYRLDPELPIEDLVSYWQMMSEVEFDDETGILTMVVRAFRPADAEQITRKVLESSEALINMLSLRSREDSLSTARRELDLAEKRFSEARKSVAAYRGTEQEIDPSAVATTQQTLVGTLESDLALKQSELTALRTTMSDNSPRVVYVQNQINALERQIQRERLSVAVPEAGQAQPVLTERLSRFEELLAERDFAERAYVSGLAALEGARVEALKQQRYLAVFITGAAPEESTYPKALRWTLIVFGAFFLAWGVFALIAAAVRDRVV